MNITMFDGTISSISYISQVPFTPLVVDYFTMETYRNIYIVAIDNEEPEPTETYVQIIRYKQKMLDH